MSTPAPVPDAQINTSTPSEDSLKRPLADAKEPPAKRLKPNEDDAAPKFVLANELRGHAKAVSSVKFSPDGKWIASCSADKTIRLWESNTGASCGTLEGHVLGINDVAWASDSRYLASGSDDKHVCLWDRTSNELVKTLKGHTNYVFCVSFNRQSDLVASGSYDESIRIWDVKSGKCLKTLPSHSDPVSSLDFSRDGSLLVSGSFDGLVRLWDTNSGHCDRTIPPTENFPVSFVKFSPNAQFILSATLNSSLKLWKYGPSDQMTKCTKSYRGHVNEKYCIFATFYLGKNAQYIVAGSEDGKVCVWDLQSKQMIQTLNHSAGTPTSVPLQDQSSSPQPFPVLGVDSSSQNSLLVSASMDGSIRTWKVIQSSPTPGEAKPPTTT